MKDKIKKRQFKLNNFFNVLIRLFLFFILAVLLLFILFSLIYVSDLLYNVKTGKTDNPLFGAYVVVTESMVPTINVNDAVIVKRVDDHKIDVGDIITFSPDTGYYAGLSITHRIVGKQITNNGSFVYRTKGDNNEKEDLSLVYERNIYGKVVLRLPMIGYIRKFVLSPGGFVVSLVIPVVFVVLYEVFRIVLLYRKKNKEIEII